MAIKKIYASSFAVLDSNVHTGGGTDDTAAIQKVLDTAKDSGGVYLVMDGAALVSELKVYSNTTIECLSPDCGFYQKAQSNCAIVTNYNWTRNENERVDRNITLTGGTYNQNCLNQEHHIVFKDNVDLNDANLWGTDVRFTFGIEFYGVENLLVRDITILDFRTFAFTLCNFKRATIENVWVDLPNRMHAQNQDGFHFWGPGQFLTVHNTGGKVGDDFMNIGPDEMDKRSDITDVLVDGVFLDDADQAIRILSRGTGTIDRCTIRNVQGSYRSFGFYINSWFPDVTAGNFGDIFIENVNLTHTEPNYDYRPPVLFSVGGDIRCLTLKNIRHEYPIDNRAIAEFGLPFYATTPDTIGDYEYPSGKKPVLKNLIIDGLTVIENEQSKGLDQLQFYGETGNVIVKNVMSVKDKGVDGDGSVLKVYDCGHIDNLLISDWYAPDHDEALKGEKQIDSIHKNNCLYK